MARHGKGRITLSLCQQQIADAYGSMVCHRPFSSAGFSGLVAFSCQRGSLGWLLAAVALLILACQAFRAVHSSSRTPNPRLAFSLTALINILTFSFTQDSLVSVRHVRISGGVQLVVACSLFFAISHQ